MLKLYKSRKLYKLYSFFVSTAFLFSSSILFYIYDVSIRCIVNFLSQNILQNRHSWSPTGDKRNLTRKLLKNHWLELVISVLILRHFQFSLFFPSLAMHTNIDADNIFFHHFSSFLSPESTVACNFPETFLITGRGKMSRMSGDLERNEKISYVIANILRWWSVSIGIYGLILSATFHLPVNLSF